MARQKGEMMSKSAMYIPPDNDELRERYESTGRGGTCGVAAIAALERKPVQSVIDTWAAADGWFPAVSQVAREYLRPGYISSYLEVSRT